MGRVGLKPQVRHVWVLDDVFRPVFFFLDGWLVLGFTP